MFPKVSYVISRRYSDTFLAQSTLDITDFPEKLFDSAGKKSERA